MSQDVIFTLPEEIARQAASQIAPLIMQELKTLLLINEQRIIPEQEVCEMLKVTKRTLYNYRMKGLRASKIGKDIYYLNSDLIKFHNQNVR